MQMNQRAAALGVARTQAFPQLSPVVSPGTAVAAGSHIATEPKWPPSGDLARQKKNPRRSNKIIVDFVSGLLGMIYWIC